MCTYVSVECRGDVTLECRGVTFAGLGIWNVIRYACACAPCMGASFRGAIGSRRALDRV